MLVPFKTFQLSLLIAIMAGHNLCEAPCRCMLLALPTNTRLKGTSTLAYLFWGSVTKKKALKRWHQTAPAFFQLFLSKKNILCSKIILEVITILIDNVKWMINMQFKNISRFANFRAPKLKICKKKLSKFKNFATFYSNSYKVCQF